MTYEHRHLLTAFVMPVVTLLLAGCAFNLEPLSSESRTPRTPVAMPASLRPDDIVGRWGLAAYHRDQDRLRTEVAARDQCALAYLIDRSPDGNVLMLGHDNPQPQEMILKGSVEGKTYIGPGPSPAGADDREVVRFDGQVLILKWVDPEIAGRYGIMVLARPVDSKHKRHRLETISRRRTNQNADRIMPSLQIGPIPIMQRHTQRVRTGGLV